MKPNCRIAFSCAVFLLAASGISARAQFISSFGVGKTAFYVQTSDSTPVLDTVDNHEFLAWIADNGQSEIDDAFVNPPGGLGTVPLWPLFFYFEDFQSQAAMDNVYKSGSYTFQATTVDSDIFFESLSLMGNAYPSIPQLLNYAALQSINASADLTLRWLPFQGGTAGDYINVTIYGDNGRVFAPQLDGTATSVVVPTGTLTAGATYDAYLMFSRVVDSNTTSALGEATYARDTWVTLKTSAGGTVMVNISGYSIVTNGLFSVQVSGTPGATVALEGTTDFGGWTQVDYKILSTGTGSLSDPNTAANPHRFYRVKAM